MTNAKLGMIFVDEIVDNPDGTVTIKMTVPEETRKAIIEKYGWTEWSEEEFQKMVLDGLHKAANEMKEESK